jgi:hypothetical protein
MLVHVVGGLLLVCLAAWLFLRAARTEDSWSGRLTESVIRVVALGASREQWTWQLRLANAGLGAIALPAAIALWVSA